MKTWGNFKNVPKSFTNMTKEESTLIDTLAFLHATRIKMHISQMELSKKTGLTQPQIARLENLDVQPTFSTLNRYAAGLGFNIQISIVPA
ncbi:MAG: helix-turn-helix domain-containing protein [Lactobacillus sp.]|jgi:DNA-binding XRE family transcriptional regulator|nr:helix-turn-helix domain-containing protein [Lactobacillus sp.]